MEAIILAGGKGTRLRSVVSDVPKPMANVAGRPFLEWELDYLKAKGFKHIVLAVGYMADVIKNHFKNEYKGLKISYSMEETPLFTGGAIKRAIQKIYDDEFFIVNGDTFLDIDFNSLIESKYKHNADVSIACKQLTNFDRYGVVEIKYGIIQRFLEKTYTEKGCINSGVYFTSKKLLNSINQEAFSFEKEVLEKAQNGYTISAIASDGYFIDIGIPEDYQKINEDFKNKKFN